MLHLWVNMIKKDRNGKETSVWDFDLKINKNSFENMFLRILNMLILSLN